MQIDATQEKEVEFGTLGDGDPFWYNTHLYVKIDAGASATFNAARLDVGTALNLTPAIKVWSAQVKIVNA